MSKLLEVAGLSTQDEEALKASRVVEDMTGRTSTSLDDDALKVVSVEPEEL
jgi:hypothetical protein